jgi:predicted transcriptional regulator
MTQELVLFPCDSNAQTPDKNQRLTVRQLAKELSYCPSMVHRYLQRGMPPFFEAAKLWLKQNVRQGPTTYTQIAKAIGVSRQMVFNYVCNGCPTTNVNDALQWYGENIKKTKIRLKHSSRLDCFAENQTAFDVAPSPGYVYLLIEEGSPFVKIGFSSSQPHCRANSCQTGNPREIFLLQFRRHKYARSIERRLHLTFSKYRKSGEWFNVDVWRVLKELDSIPEWIDWIPNDKTIEEVAA